MKKVLKELEKISKAIGVKDLPFNAGLLADDPASNTPKTYKNLVEMHEWMAYNLDSLIGKFPREIPFFDDDGKQKKVEVKDLGHWCDEAYQLLAVTADDADSAVNVAFRAVVEAVHTKIVANQALDAVKANAEFLGYATQPKVKKLKLSVTPAAAGSDGKLQPQEMGDFLKRSTRNYASFECADKQRILPMMARILEDGEIARAALYRPLKPGLKGVTGDSIKESRKKSKAADKQFDRFMKDMEKAGFEVKVVSSKSRGKK